MNPSLPFLRRAILWSICSFCLCLPLSIAGANISWGLLLAGLLAYRAAGGAVAFRAHRSILEWPLIVYLVVAVLAAALGVAPSNSFCHMHQDVHKLWFYVLFSVALATEPAAKAILAMAAGFSVACAIGLLQIPWGYLMSPEWPRARAFMHPVTFGEQVCIAALGAVCFLAKPPAFFKGQNARLLTWTFLALTLAALFLSQTRGAILSLLAGLTAVASLAPKLRRFVLVALLAVAANWVFVGTFRYDLSLKNQAREWVALESSAAASDRFVRLSLWKVAWRMGKDHPWTGVGPNNYRAVLPQYLQTTFEDLSDSWGTAHNLFLHHFAERGLLGLGAVLLFLGAFWSRALQRVRERPNAWNLWAYGVASAFPIMNLTEVALQVETVWMLVFFIWLWAEALHRRTAEGIL